MVNRVESLYIHFPFCRHLCNYCDFYKKIPKSREDLTPFEQSLDAQLEKHKEIFSQKHKWSPLETLYIGGGTPSLWGKRGALFLKDLFEKHEISLKEEGEFTLEVNPGTWTEEGLNSWQEFGINRFSLGVQSLRSDYLKILDRVHSIEDVHNTLKYFSNNKLHFSVDFMLGLPWSQSKKRNIIEELEEIFQYDPEHLSLYILTAKGGYPFKKDLPEDDLLESEFLSVSDRLKKEGYEHYEVSNFAKKGAASKHNLRYWRCESVAALGASAVGFLKEDNLRYKWLVNGINFSEEKLNNDEIFLERLYMGLRISEGIKPKDLFDKKHEDEITQLLNEWTLTGLGHGGWGAYSLSSKGFLILDSLLEKLYPFF
jgi:oxygen-independent coproporphyrinogen III oxidase